MTNLKSILTIRHIALPTKVCLVKAMVFPVGMYGCDSWTIKKAEGRRIDDFFFFLYRNVPFYYKDSHKNEYSISKSKLDYQSSPAELGEDRERAGMRTDPI